MSKLYTCEECGGEFTKRELNWDGSDHTDGVYYCKDCFRFLEQCGIDAMDPDGFGYDEYGNWDQERLGFQIFVSFDYYIRYNFSLFIHQPAHWAGFWRLKETIKPEFWTNTLRTASASPYRIYVTDFVSFTYNLKAVF